MFHPVDDAPQFYIKYRTSSNGINWSTWWQTENLDVAVSSSGMCPFSWVLSAGTAFQSYIVMVGPNKDDSEPSNTVMGIVPNAPIQAPPYLEAYAVYREGAMAAQLYSDAFPSAATGYAIWRRDAGQAEWASIGIADGRSVKDPLSEPDKSYEYVIAWYDSSVPTFISDFSNIARVTIPPNSSMVLLPPIRYDASFVEQNGSYYIRLDLGAGDMRATKVVIQYRLNSGAWSADSVMTWSDASLAVFGRYIMIGFSGAPIPFDKWQLRLKNRATGYTDSAWSELFEVTVPSFLPRLDTPVLSLHQEAEHVLAGWNSVANAAGYKLERMQQGQSSYTLIASLASNVIRYEDYGVSRGNTYYYRLTALGDNQYYQDSLSVTQQIEISSVVTVPQPVIDSAVEQSNTDIVLTISNIDPPNTSAYRIEMSENNGSWRDLYGDYPSSMSVSSFTTTVNTAYILEGGSLRFRVKVVPLEGAAVAPNPYSAVYTLVVDEREWLLRWTGSAWDYCTSITGGWYAPNWVDGYDLQYNNLVATDLGQGVLRIAGSGNTSGYGFWTNRTGLTTNTSLRSKYKQVCMIGKIVKQLSGGSYAAVFGTAWDYTYAQEWHMDMTHGTSKSAGNPPNDTVENPYVTACTTYTYAPRNGSHVYLYFNNGYADVKGIFATKV